ncbi:short-chain dehydrogenase TIC 32 B, chloroplastic-like isoform X1 [Phoenix dactylifera]|uniref:Short-chain dehydrogenase TIC 32 B, chloroplastic-like isoform X1 n=1 Tax=Phoenix dactylifera TaxID=42345 RepID=A0A8B8J8U7_PHODC|nr:short-chain dehydrogenase TIC 32 B, chloroplastic-like isoform X1 [Phoenix dactylifera]
MLETVRYLMGSAGASGFGSKSTAEEVTGTSPDLRSITAIITGATSGIGAETARVLAKRGARLVLPARNLKAAEEIKARIAADSPGSHIIVLPLDLSSLSSVRSFASRFLSLRLPLHLLINNAGKFPHDLAISEDGIEMTFATNYLGHFLLTKLLLEKMAETARETGIQGRIVNVSSSIHGWFSGDVIRYLDLVTRRKIPYDATRVYALSKLANVLHTRELAERLKDMDANVTVNCVHPGVVRTGLTRDREGFVTGNYACNNESREEKRPCDLIPVALDFSLDGRSDLLPRIQAPQEDSPGGGDDVLRGDAPECGGRVGEVLRGLQRGVAIVAGRQPARVRAAVARVGGPGRREAAAGRTGRDVG